MLNGPIFAARYDQIGNLKIRSSHRSSHSVYLKLRVISPAKNSIYLYVSLPLRLTTPRKENRSLNLLVEMPTLQGSLPPELANNVVRLYRECLRRATFIGKQQHNTELVVGMVRQQFKKHMNETDPEKIQKLKDDAARGLINHMLFESEKLTGRKVSQRS
ncbi:Complex 1 LYR protein [Raphanus sativus]|nr:Complex 1 LYR protein [Raphanus sativus]